MTAGTSAILIAAVGVIGTLLSGLVSQQMSARTRRRDFEMQKSQRQEDRLHDQRQLTLAAKRSSYVAVMENARRFRHELVSYLYERTRGTTDSASDAELRAARRAFVAAFAEAQLTASPPVLAMIEPFNLGLSQAYRDIKQLEDADTAPKGAVAELEDFLGSVWSHWDDMRAAMRRDLGTED
jgi:hypothetical protein